MKHCDTMRQPCPNKPECQGCEALEQRNSDGSYDGIEMAAASNGLALLRDIFEVRNGLQHTGPYAPAEIAQQRLGLRTWEGNWEVSWNIVRAAAVDGMNGVRSSLRALIDDRTAGSTVSP